MSRSTSPAAGRAESSAATLLLAVALVLGAACGERGDFERPIRTLAAGAMVRGSLGSARTPSDRYAVVLLAGQSARVVLDQHYADLELTYSSDGEAPQRSDMRGYGIETLTLLADRDTTFLIEVRSKDTEAAPEPYDIRVEPARTAAEPDRMWQRGERFETDARDRLGKTSRDSSSAALDDLHAALAIWHRLDDDLGRAATQARIADIHNDRGEFTQSEPLYRAALEIYDRMKQPYAAAVVHQNFAVALGRSGRLREAREHFTPARTVFQESSRPAVAAGMVSEGTLYFEAGDFQEALDRYHAARAVFRARQDPNERLVLASLGTVSRAVGDLESARAYLAQAIDGAPEGIPKARAQVRLGEVAFEAGNLDSARALAEQALPVLQAAGVPGGEADALDLLGQCALAMGVPDRAMAYFERALVKYGEAPRGRSTALHHMAGVYRARGDLPAARDRLERAALMRDEVGLLDAAAESWYDLGALEARAGSAGRAEPHLLKALALVEQVRGHVAGASSRTAYLAARRKYFAATIAVTLKLDAERPGRGYASRAFEIAERERARSLIDLLRDAGTTPPPGAAQERFDEILDLRRQLDFWSYRLARLSERPAPAPDAVDVRRRVDELTRTYRESVGRLGARQQQSAALLGAPTLTLREVQEHILERDTALVRFFLSEPESYAWIVTTRSLEVETLPSRTVIEKTARQVADLIRVPPPLARADVEGQFGTAVARLSGLLLAPIAKAIGGARRLLIVADGTLQMVPFSALSLPGDVLPLLHRYETVMLPSASALGAVRAQVAYRQPASHRLALFADPVYESEDPRLAGRNVTDLPAAEKLDVGRLPLSKLEGEFIIGLVPVSERFAAFGFAATREAALSRLRDFGIVHFAAHAVAPDPRRPELDSIVLSLFDQDGRRRDGLLRAYDITAGLRAELVVLAACSTAIGDDVPGEGMMGLARSFIAAGAATVVASLYKVDERPTLELMKEMYAGMLGPRSLSPAAALRAAQIALSRRREFQAPHYWAAFVAIGNYGG